MKSESRLPSVVFMGTPDFATPSLKRLLEAGAPVLEVVTQPDRPKGRGKKFVPSPVKVFAEQRGLPVYQPPRTRDAEAIEHICSLGAECLVVVAFGQILPTALMERHRLGALNVHGSLLPKYRGAAPIQRAIAAGDTVTGISIMLLDAGMDTGPVLSQREMIVTEEDNFGTVHDRMSLLGAELLCETLAAWGSGRIVPKAQDDSLANNAPPIGKDELRIEWDRPARSIVNRIRAFDPVPGAFAGYDGKRMKLFSASLLPWRGEGGPGEIVGHTEKGLVVLAGDGQALSIGEVQLEGHRRLPASQFLRGRPMPPGAYMQ